MPQSIKLTFEDMNFKNGYSLLLSKLIMTFSLTWGRSKGKMGNTQPKEKEPSPQANCALTLHPCQYVIIPYLHLRN